MAKIPHHCSLGSSSCSGKVDESSFYISPDELNANSISDIKNPTALIV
jgi:hypothetical protein